MSRDDDVVCMCFYCIQGIISNKHKRQKDKSPVSAVPPLHGDALNTAGAHSQHYGEGAHVAVAAAAACCLALDGRLPLLPLVPTSCRSQRFFSFFIPLLTREDCSMTPCCVGVGEERYVCGMTDEIE